MTKVLPLSRWAKHDLPHRDEYSDEDSEDESSSDEEPIAYPVPRKKPVPMPTPPPPPFDLTDARATRPDQAKGARAAAHTG